MFENYLKITRAFRRVGYLSELSDISNTVNP